VIGDAVVIDTVVHGYHLADENLNDLEFGREIVGMVYGAHQVYSPRGEEKWILSRARFYHANDPDLVGHALFAESQTDLAIYHGVPLFGLTKDGGSPLWVGAEMRRRWPGRVLLYGPASPFMPGVLDEIDRMVEEDGIVGLKLYPWDLVNGESRSWRMDDEKQVFPILERARSRGIKSVAVHKALPLGRVHIEPFLVTDIEGAAMAFPDLNIEIVHGGFAFLEETALQLLRFPNVCVNLEGSGAFVVNMPGKFAELLAAFLAVGGEDRIIWATGCMLLHPRPFIEAFWNFQMPERLIEDYGCPPLTDAIKRKILGGNIARILGLDLGALRSQYERDEFAQRDGLAEPWSKA
jgi:predicted TIM-barrel fold metal-dependent hydrolase